MLSIAIIISCTSYNLDDPLDPNSPNYNPCLIAETAAPDRCPNYCELKPDDEENCPKGNDGDGDGDGNVTVPEKHTYGIRASALASFGALQSPYAQPVAREVIVTNTGSGAVTLSQPSAENYIVGQLSNTILAAQYETARFTVQPKEGLPVGEYIEVIDITGNNGAVSTTVTVMFEVTLYEPPLTYIIDPSTPEPFGSHRRPYENDVEEQTVIITNKGTGTITLRQPSAVNYVIGTLSKTVIEKDETAEFTIRPKSDLAVGDHTEEITIEGSDAAPAKIIVVFVVLPDPVVNDPGDNDPSDNNSGDNNPGDNDPGDNNPGNNDPGNNDPGDNNPGNNDPGNNDPSDPIVVPSYPDDPPYDITFYPNCDAVTYTMISKTDADGRLTSFPALPQCGDDHIFIGWYDDPAGDGDKLTLDNVFSGPGNVYARWIILGHQIDVPESQGDAYMMPDGKYWMAKNLDIPIDDGERSWCYDEDPDNCIEYGRLYIWDAAVEACNGLGNGWRLPDTADWNRLAEKAGGTDVAAKALKSKSGWGEDGNGTDEFKFNALPGGRRTRTDPPTFSEAGSTGHWWSATEDDRNPTRDDMDNAFWQRMRAYDVEDQGGYISKDVLRSGPVNKNFGYSVRCIMDP